MIRRALPVLFLLALIGCGKVEMFASLPEREANEVIAVLMRAGITADKVAGRNNAIAVHVPRDRIPDAVEILARAGLPRERFANMGELFRREGLISSPSEERVRYMYGVTQELSRTLSAMDGVLTARVHVVMPNNEPSSGTQRPASAAVMIRHLSGSPVETGVPQVKELVANAIEGLSYDRVSVVLTRATAEEAPPPPLPSALPLGLPPAALWLLGGGLVLSVLVNLGLLVALLLRGRRGTGGVPAVGTT